MNPVLYVHMYIICTVYVHVLVHNSIFTSDYRQHPSSPEKEVEMDEGGREVETYIIMYYYCTSTNTYAGEEGICLMMTWTMFRISPKSDLVFFIFFFTVFLG